MDNTWLDSHLAVITDEQRKHTILYLTDIAINTHQEHRLKDVLQMLALIDEEEE